MKPQPIRGTRTGLRSQTRLIITAAVAAAAPPKAGLEGAGPGGLAR